MWTSYAIAVALPVVTLLQAICVNQYFWLALHLGVLVRGAVAAAVCRRVLELRLCEGGGGLADSGLLSNLISSDCGRLMTACGNLNMVRLQPCRGTPRARSTLRSRGPDRGGRCGRRRCSSPSR